MTNAFEIISRFDSEFPRKQAQQQGDFGTRVIGRRGVSRAEEFLFGSVTTKVTHLAKDRTVWKVQ